MPKGNKLAKENKEKLEKNIQHAEKLEDKTADMVESSSTFAQLSKQLADWAEGTDQKLSEREAKKQQKKLAKEPPKKEEEQKDVGFVDKMKKKATHLIEEVEDELTKKAQKEDIKKLEKERKKQEKQNGESLATKYPTLNPNNPIHRRKMELNEEDRKKAESQSSCCFCFWKKKTPEEQPLIINQETSKKGWWKR